MTLRLKIKRTFAIFLALLIALAGFSVMPAKAATEHTYDLSSLSCALTDAEVEYLHSWVVEASHEGLVTYELSDDGAFLHFNINPFMQNGEHMDLNLCLNLNELRTNYDADVSSCNVPFVLKEGIHKGDRVVFQIPNWYCHDKVDHKWSIPYKTDIAVKKASVSNNASATDKTGELLIYAECTECHKFQFDTETFTPGSFGTGIDRSSSDMDHWMDYGVFGDFVYTGSAITPYFHFMGDSEDEDDDLAPGYKTTWANNIDVGTAKLTISFPASHKYYTGSFTKTFKILPKGTKISTLRPGRRSIKVVWKKQAAKMSKSRITGYQVQIATNKKFSKNKKMITLNGYKKTSTTIKKLKSGKKYFVRVRTFKKVGSKKYYSPWSKAKTAVIK